MKKLFLTVALVGGMLSFAAMKTGNTTEPVKQTKTVVMAEEILDPEYCTFLAWECNDATEGGLNYTDMDIVYMYCICCL